MKKKNRKLILSLLLSVVMLTAPAFVKAADRPKKTEKSEVVYAVLDNSGSISDIYVVNILDIPSEGNYIDYGNYDSVKNLTDTSDISVSGDSVTFNAPAGDFYYQGNLGKKALPWILNISYYLDGKSISPDTLAGRSGNLRIVIDTKNNPDVNETFFNNYLMQISVTLNTEKCSDISAKGATIANAGKNKIVNFTAFPKSSHCFEITASVANFEMEGMTFSAVPYSMQFETPDTEEFTSGMTDFADAIASLNKGVGDLKDGADKLNTGASSLSSGSSAIADALGTLSSAASDLVNGSEYIAASLNTISTSLSSAQMPDLSQLPQLLQALNDIADGLDTISGNITALKNGYNAAFGALSGSINDIPDTVITQQQLDNLVNANSGSQENLATINSLISYYSAATIVKGTYNDVDINTFFSSLSGTLDAMSASISTISGNIRTISTAIANSLSGGGDLTQLIAGISALNTAYIDFHNGLTNFAAGVSGLSNEYGAFNSGVSSLAGGASELAKGISKLREGTGKLEDATSDMSIQIEEEIDELLDIYTPKDFLQVSFVSEKNLLVDSVQFVIKTEGIKIPEKIVDTDDTQVSKSFLDKFLDLFR
ncbi:MAG: YhgE/Pip domain-containing protein [Ruminococcaceae bacterium]|nr:YhgE/Pip domain-containing protein [Oscillospiraceae bacterium]